MAEQLAITPLILTWAKELLLSVFNEIVVEDSSSSSSQANEAAEIQGDLMRLMRVLEKIEATMHDAYARGIRDELVRQSVLDVAYDAEDLLDEYRYRVLEAQVQTQGASAVNSRKQKHIIQIKYLGGNKIKRIMYKFEEVRFCMLAVRLYQEKDEQRQIDLTGRSVVEQKIFGREKEKEQLINFLFSECHAGQVVSMVAVVGTGGIGKTSFVQLAYDDQRIRQKFHKVGWIFVSEDFSVERLTREALKSITNQGCDLTDLSALQERFCKEVRGKRLLLVLDDVRIENMGLWKLFCNPFKSAKLVKIVITTRNEVVARMMNTESTLNLGYLSLEESWQLFQHYAFNGINQNDKLKLINIGREIMKKCGLLPLAIKLVSSMLRYEAEEESWREILESELWGVDYHDVLTPLMISFSHLPEYLKPCILFCSMFPKDYELNVENLSQFWVAQGYIESREGKFIRTGQEYIKQLWQRSFFDCQFKGSDFKNSKLKLHGLLHDLAMFISRRDFSISSERDIHLYVMNNMELVQPHPSNSLRTLTVENNVENFLIAADISKLLALRVLELKSQCCDSEFLSSIGNLNKLRYLSFRSFSFQRLPESIGLLYHLQNLALTECTNLEELPDGIRNLVNLQVLRLSSCLRFQRLPECVGKFCNLEKLVLDKCDIKELPAGLCQLYALQELLITGCRNLKDLPEDIGRLSALETLVIEATGVRYLPHSLNNVKGLKRLILTFKKREQ